MHPASYLQSRDPLLDNPLLPDGVEWTDTSGSAPYPRYVLDGGAWVQVGGGGATVDGKRIATIMVVADATTLTTGDGKEDWYIPSTLDGFNLVAVSAYIPKNGTVSSSGNVTLMIHNLTDEGRTFANVQAIVPAGKLPKIAPLVAPGTSRSTVLAVRPSSTMPSRATCVPSIDTR
jgi:hypothetical protein